MKYSPKWAALALALVIGGLTGCGGGADGRVTVKGKLLDDGKPFVLDKSKLKLPSGATSLPPGSNPLVVSFIPVESGETTNANVSADTGTFEANGTDGKGIKPGKYKIAVTATVGGADYFGGKFAPDKTQIIRDVKPGEEIIIDVSKPQG
jgi:hypothetical protein